jgi:multidrug efflux system outer membrane protein
MSPIKIAAAVVVGCIAGNPLFAAGPPEPSSSPSNHAPWWGIFQDGALDRLEEQAIQANQDLRQAVARVMEARAQAGMTASGFYPNLSVPLLASRQRTTNTGPITVSRLVGPNPFSAATSSALPDTFAGQALTNTYDDFQAPLVVGYEIDVFGRIRHAYDQARANAQASLADRQEIKLSLTSQVAANYFALRAADSEMAVLQSAVRLRADAVQIQERRVKGGAASDVDLLRARVEEANTEADLVDSIQERAELESALAELCGQPAGDFHIAPQTLDQILPPDIPATITAQLVTQRPDLVEAERRIVAAGEGVKAARAQFFPVLDVQAGYGFESSQANQLLENQSHTWSIAGAINIPIFDGGRDAAGLKAARARNEQALGAYREATLKALREVNNALSNLRQRAVQADARRRAAEDARRVFQASQQSYTQGAMTYFEVIDAQRVLLNAELSQVRTLGIRYAATVELIRATGGGFEDPSDDSK